MPGLRQIPANLLYQADVDDIRKVSEIVPEGHVTRWIPKNFTEQEFQDFVVSFLDVPWRLM